MIKIKKQKIKQIRNYKVKDKKKINDKDDDKKMNSEFIYVEVQYVKLFVLQSY